MNSVPQISKFYVRVKDHNVKSHPSSPGAGFRGVAAWIEAVSKIIPEYDGLSQTAKLSWFESL
jgi:hypothetical protein